MIASVFLAIAIALANSGSVWAESASPTASRQSLNLPEPYHTPSATNPPRVVSKPGGAELKVPSGFAVEEYLDGFSGPRFMTLGNSGEILLSDMDGGIVYSIKDKKPTPLIKGLKEPYGLAVQGNWLYVADVRAVARYRYDGTTASVNKPEEIIALKQYASGHSTRNILFSADGSKLYLAVGSESNVASGEPPIRAAISRYNADGSGQEIFASGLRNPVGLRWNPTTKELWTSVIERDSLGDDLVPDYLTAVKQGGFYGWPYAYLGTHEDPRHPGEAPEQVKKTLVPELILGSHETPLDFVFYTGQQFPERFRNGCFISLHGSWNRSESVGQKIVFVPFNNGKPSGPPEDFLTGWLLDPKKSQVWGRPVGLLQMPDGSLLISDDGAGKLWRVSYRP
jgi:glucose/arabinose dehydrogenase